MSTDLFQHMVFVTDKGIDEVGLGDIVRKHGGTVSSVVNPQTTYVLSTLEKFNQRSVHIDRATKRGIPVIEQVLFCHMFLS